MKHEALKRQNLKTFFKCGCVVCTLLLLGAAAFHFVAPTVTISGAAEARKIPIYCVDTDKKQVALSFDAACASCCLRKYDMYSPVYMGS